MKSLFHGYAVPILFSALAAGLLLASYAHGPAHVVGVVLVVVLGVAFIGYISYDAYRDYRKSGDKFHLLFPAGWFLIGLSVALQYLGAVTAGRILGGVVLVIVLVGIWYSTYHLRKLKRDHDLNH
jgi:hypothetical protein